MTLSILILKKKSTLISWLTHQLVLAIDLVCSRIFISGSFFVFSSFASFVFFMVCYWSAGHAGLLFFLFGLTLGQLFLYSFSLLALHCITLYSFFVCSLKFLFLQISLECYGMVRMDPLNFVFLFFFLRSQIQWMWMEVKVLY